ncbi:hypothetical protein R3W88_008720 [Solanum pinnatisectum]|uniref:Uncharacterized protein n=1 Tax=Solanum pinnatisectum TaxID=50273 RepID=A0AAV9MBK4_9SOLN|nr:hypothetical protein R3W88_008720 [Solanum pinnatisectum]
MIIEINNFLIKQPLKKYIHNYKLFICDFTSISLSFNKRLVNQCALARVQTLCLMQ